jgi:SAM-dependent methyltransferase
VAPTQAYTGIELMPRDVQRAEAAVGALPLAPRFVCGDMREVALPACELVVILDVLHYVDHADQRRVLEKVHAALVPQGRLLLRVGDMDQARGFWASQWVDRLVTWVRGHRTPPTWGRPLVAWQALLQELGFAVRPVPMSAGTPFANVLLVADRR